MQQPPHASALARANERLADASTPLIEDCWYIAGWAEDFSRELKERTLLGHSLVFYRDTKGTPVALRNRCPHRSYPLVHGKLEGDVLRCGYHGLAFRADGSCADIPMQTSIPPTACTRSYPLVEQGPLVWIWTGDPAAANTSRVPDTGWLTDSSWDFARGYLHLNANYAYLHENLLDLSHFTYLHPSTLGTPEYAKAPFEMQAEGDTVRITRFVAECEVPPMYRPTGIEGKMSRRTYSEFSSPALHRAEVELRDLQAPASRRAEFHGRITHFVTPETRTSTHYWFTFARDFALRDPAVTAMFESNARTAFAEDKFALEEAARMHRLEPEATRLEIHVKSDAAGGAARRLLKQMADKQIA
ncbi:Rieske 2Fe-2S domain-containing protein [Piscinibacter sp.]|uniref:Rieske 2Fe-2S domain-containing protein n=1 Tax=Piscinibacter sp. TaxID=1903157 RepID=UPI0039E3A918